MSNNPSNPSYAPILTYRQFHSKKIGPQHPLRVIAHCDVDAAYAQFEQVRLKIPPDKPLAVQQWRGLIAVNYPAREFGITRHLPFDEAKKKCPDLICVHVATYAQGDSETEAKYHENPHPDTHKVSLDPYRRESVKILKIFLESCPTIEKASIDEAFLDFSIPVREIICSRYQIPTLSTIQQSSQISLDDPVVPPPQLDWISVSKDLKSNVVPVESEGSEPSSWSDIALMVGAELMAECRHKVFNQLGYTCSAGIATNKMLAKLCSAYKKPDSQTVLRPTAVKGFLRPFDLTKIRFLGGKLGQSVNDLISPINDTDETKKSCTIGEIWKIPLTQLQSNLGEETGTWVWEIVRGVDNSEVETKTQVKSMMSSKNFRPSISTWEQGIHWLHLLAKDLCARLKEAQLVTPGIWPKSIVMHKRDESYNSLAKQTAFPFTSQLTDQYIFSFGQKLLQDFAGANGREMENAKTNRLGTVTSLALAFHTLERIEPGQRGIKGFFSPITNSTNKPLHRNTVQNLTSAPVEFDSNQCDSFNLQNRSTRVNSPTLDILKQGDFSPRVEGSIKRRSMTSPSKEKMMNSNPLEPQRKKRKTNEQNIEAKSSEPLLEAKKIAFSDDSFQFSNVDHELESTELNYVCERCQEIISVAKRNDDEFERIEAQDRFERLKTLHLDEHFAQDVWQLEKSNSVDPRSTSESSKSQAHVTSKQSFKSQSGSRSKSKHQSASDTNSQTKSANHHASGIKSFFKPIVNDKNPAHRK